LALSQPAHLNTDNSRRAGRRISFSNSANVLTTFEQDDYILDALTAGASGFLLKRT
jgi:DNA-binding NarL/FixJ family response regulator